MKYQVKGTTLQVAVIRLEPGESVYTESGGMAWMTSNIDMETNVRGGVLKGLGRKLAGESMFMTTYTCNSGTGLIAFTNESPGNIIPLNLGAGETIIVQKDAFMCAESSVTLEMHFRKKLGAGLFGGEGFILQKLTGPGTAFLEMAGEITKYTLEGEHMLKVDPGHIGAFEPTVDFDIARVKGVRNIFFSGEGLFLATLKGPGTVWLQSMPLANLARKLSRYMAGK
ncbi:MAG: TIGR00266 family protein [Theionarchaea archaeon]|nr:MAG: hypothetical protein AYK18_10745 [Theionarchaea archaeon DG-70]MBU7011571.1 TIGR00266 family protein [Theionarchaea archaeon]